MSIDWRARRERARCNKPPQIPDDTECARCKHKRYAHAAQHGRTDDECHAEVELSVAPRRVYARCECENFVQLDSVCTCGHRYGAHAQRYKGHECLTGGCRCKGFKRATL